MGPGDYEIQKSPDNKGPSFLSRPKDLNKNKNPGPG